MFVQLVACLVGKQPLCRKTAASIPWKQSAVKTASLHFGQVLESLEVTLPAWDLGNQESPISPWLLRFEVCHSWDPFVLHPRVSRSISNDISESVHVEPWTLRFGIWYRYLPNSGFHSPWPFGTGLFLLQSARTNGLQLAGALLQKLQKPFQSDPILLAMP